MAIIYIYNIYINTTKKKRVRKGIENFIIL